MTLFHIVIYFSTRLSLAHDPSFVHYSSVTEQRQNVSRIKRMNAATVCTHYDKCNNCIALIHMQIIMLSKKA